MGLVAGHPLWQDFLHWLQTSQSGRLRTEAIFAEAESWKDSMLSFNAEAQTPACMKLMRLNFSFLPTASSMAVSSRNTRTNVRPYARHHPHWQVDGSVGNRIPNTRHNVLFGTWMGGHLLSHCKRYTFVIKTNSPLWPGVRTLRAAHVHLEAMNHLTIKRLRWPLAIV